MKTKYADFFTSDLKYELNSFVDLYFFQSNNISNNGPLPYMEFIVDNDVLHGFLECSSLFG